MKKIIALALVAMFATQAFAATAFFTGNQRMVQTVTYQMAWQCEYNYNGRTFTRIFQGSCPMSIEVF